MRGQKSGENVVSRDKPDRLTISQNKTKTQKMLTNEKKNRRENVGADYVL